MSARLIQVIEVLATRGRGTEKDLARTVRQYWSTDGILLAEVDPCPGGVMPSEEDPDQ